MPGRRKVVRIAAWTAGVMVALLFTAAIAIPFIVNSPGVAAQLEAKLSETVGGEVRWESLQIRLLPRPRGALRGFSVKTAAATVEVDAVDINLAFLPLLRGRAEIVSLSIARPVVHLDLAAGGAHKAAAAPKAEEAPADPAAVYRSVVNGVRNLAPETVITVENGELAVQAGDMPPIDLTKITLRAQSSEPGMHLELQAEGTRWRQLSLNADVTYGDLSTEATLQALDVKPQVWLDWSLSASPVRVGLPNAVLNARFRGAIGKPFEGEVSLSAGEVELRHGERSVRVPDVGVTARLNAQAGEVTIHPDAIRLGASLIGGGTLRYLGKDGSLAGDVAYDFDLAQVLEYARAFAPASAADALARVSPPGERAKGRVKLAIAKDLSVGVELGVLDGKVSASATLSDFERGPRIQASLAESTLGPQLLAWIWQTASLPAGVTLKAPIRVAVPRVVWAPNAPLELRVNAGFDAGAQVGADLSWSKGALNLRRASVTDKLSNASLSLQSKGGVVQGRYSGTLDSRSLAGILVGTAELTGALNGDLRFTYDHANRRRSSASGTLRGDKIDLSWLAGKPANIERIDLSADGESLRIAEATVQWAGQRATLRGDIKRTAAGPVVDAQIDSPGVVVDALLPEKKEKKEVAEAKSEKESKSIWPLPVTGRIALRSDFVQYKHLKVAPVVTALVLEPERAHVEMKEAALCGISLPFTLEATPRGYVAAAQTSAVKQPMEQVALCLSNEKVALTGTFVMKSDLRAEGKLTELVQNLGGTVDVDVRNGLVKEFALIGNILAMQNVVALVAQGGPKLGAEGFPFRQLHAAGRFEKGRFVIEEGVFHSNSIGLGANGWISLSDFQCRLTVLVAPLAIANEVMSKLPVLGYISGGALTSLPVGVSGDIRSPLVIPLGPGAITYELVGIFTRTITLPEEARPGGREKDSLAPAFRARR